MKKRYIVIIVFLLVLIFVLLVLTRNKAKVTPLPIKKEIENVEINDLSFNIDSEVKLSEVLNIETDELLDTSNPGENTKEYYHEDKKYIIHYTVIDNVKPLIFGDSRSVTVGTKTNVANKFMCVDNIDDNPKCYIEGKYDLNKIGTYKVKYIAEDYSGNKTTKDVKIVVKKESSSSSSSTSASFKYYYDKYKADNTMVGIDVSSWQGNIDFKKVKEAGVEFVIIRLGFGHTNSGELVIDKYFKENIKKAKEVGLPVGVYFFSYASSVKEAIEHANFIVKELDGIKLELPIAFDWENWSTFNEYHVSIRTLNEIASAFIKEVEKHGYTGSLYSSAYYLRNIWKDFDNVWLAFYTNNNTYEKPFQIWQRSSVGKVSGISGRVDINILYK